uniref:Zinc finger protein 40-like n=1 Tax=Camelus bactrianus TaxID=9837 RepID=A0A9W3HBD7_CAMBA|nr:zinc finger protein 40-like [Camelus bactrianus]
MPRTKQIHPRNLRDKIEEAQKELNGAEVSKKEILEAGIKGTSESLKGVKRKKIVAENHLKKIPKSPLRNPLQAKHKQNTEEPPPAVVQSASGPSSSSLVLGPAPRGPCPRPRATQRRCSHLFLHTVRTNPLPPNPTHKISSFQRARVSRDH